VSYSAVSERTHQEHPKGEKTQQLVQHRWLQSPVESQQAEVKIKNTTISELLAVSATLYAVSSQR
jgi:hypothetical protein